MIDTDDHQTTQCYVKWFDVRKGFGFLIPLNGGPDILLHANVLRNAGRSTIAEGVRLDAVVFDVNGRLQADSIANISADPGNGVSKLAQLTNLDPEALKALPLQPARVKWFDLGKGIGFANVFGSHEDVFIHIEILKAAGLAGLETGEAIGLRVMQGERGLMAAEVTDWDGIAK